MKTALQPVLKYWPQYKWSNVFAMIRNMSAAPVICNENFRGKLVVITGATSGIGYLTAREFALHGARLLTINRNEAKSQALCEEIRQEFNTPCEYWLADLGRLDVMHYVGQKLAELPMPIDVLIHNAGVYLSKRTPTPDGLEKSLAIHFLAPFVINHLLKEKMKREGRGRILFVSSEGYRFAVWGPQLEDLNWEKRRYTSLGAYGAAKISQILTMHILSRELKPSGVTVNAMHPGMVRTNTGHENSPIYRFFKRHLIDRFSRSPVTSAQALYYLGASPELNDVSDRFFHLTTEEELTPPACDMEMAEKVWQTALQIGRLQ